MGFTHLLTLQPQSIQDLVHIIQGTCDPDKIILFGSRARGDHRSTSDFDVTVVGKRCSEVAWTRLIIDVDEEPITLHSVDLIDYPTLDPAYHLNIAKEGKLLYERPL